LEEFILEHYLERYDNDNDFLRNQNRKSELIAAVEENCRRYMGRKRVKKINENYIGCPYEDEVEFLE